MSLGLYISVPFCRSKCSYCNFASGVFSRRHMEAYVQRLCADIASSSDLALAHHTVRPENVDSIYLGGGTPSLLPPAEVTKLFTAVASEFDLALEGELTVECAPGTLSQPMLETLVSCGVNRVSLGVQSFVDLEAASVARLHTRAKVLEDIASLRSLGITNINIDLIAGLPHQTLESWTYSLDQAIAIGVPHISVYMLEVDDDSRLGRELIAGGARYHAHFVPDEDLTADLYEMACSQLDRNRIQQYEISNFARPGFESKHNLKYWTRQPYLGFGVDAHSMLLASPNLQKQGLESVRLSTTDSLDDFLLSHQSQAILVDPCEALEESFFLGLRLNRGLKLDELELAFGPAVGEYVAIVDELVTAGMLSRVQNTVQLTPRGRLLSNEVFARFMGEPQGRMCTAQRSRSQNLTTDER